MGDPVSVCVNPRLSKAFLEQRRRIEVLEVARTALIATRKRAKFKKLAFALTDDDLRELLTLQDYCCALTGIPFAADRGDATECFRAPYRPSIDRIQATDGYVRSNVRLVLVAVNIARGEWGDAQLIEIARAIVAKHA